MQTTTFSHPQLEISIQSAINNWHLQNQRLSSLLENLSNQQLSANIAPARNSGTYILGHIIAVHDGMLPLLNLQSKLYPELQELFIDNSDKAGFIFPTIEELKNCYETITNTLNLYFCSMPVQDWLSKHEAISEEEFQQEPHRNKLNVLINRTNHLSYHLGQLILLKNN